MLNAGPHLGRRARRKSSQRAGFSQRAQPRGRRMAGRHNLFRVFIAQFGERKRAARGDPHGRCHPGRRIQRRQPLARAQMRLGIALQRKSAVGYRQTEPGGAEHVLQRLAAAAVHQHIAGRHQRQPNQIGHLRQRRQAQRVMWPVQQLDRDGAALHPEPGLQPHRVGINRLLGLLRLRQQNRKTPRQPRQKRRMRHPPLQVRNKCPVLPLGRPPPRHRDPLRQVAVTPPRLRQQQQARRRMAGQDRGGGEQWRRHVHGCCRRWRLRCRQLQLHLRPDDERHAQPHRLTMRPHHARQRALVGQRQRGVPPRLRLRHQLLRVRRPGQKAEVAAAVEFGVGREHGSDRKSRTAVATTVRRSDGSKRRSEQQHENRHCPCWQCRCRELSVLPLHEKQCHCPYACADRYTLQHLP